MRSLEIRRHSFTKKGDARGHGSHLSAEGVAAARRLGARLGHFDYVVASSSPRTLETAVAMGFAVDELVEMPSPAATSAVAFHEWREWANPFGELRRIATKNSEFAGYATTQAELALSVIDQLDDGSAALIVGHGGWIETVISRLVRADDLKELGGSFWHLDGIRLAFADRTVAADYAIDRHN